MTNPNILTQLKKLLINNPQLRDMKSKEIKKFINAHLPGLNLVKEHNQIIFDILFPEKIHPCENSNFVGHAVGYRSCRKNCPCYTQRLSEIVRNVKSGVSLEEKSEILAKRKETVLSKYGVTNVFLSEIIKERSSSTKTEKYSDPKFRNPEKIKETNFIRYGVDNPLKSTEIKNKIRDTNLAKFGVVNPLESELVKSKVKETLIAKYGVENPRSIPENLIKQADDFFENLPNRIGENYSPLFTREEYVGVNRDYLWRCETCIQPFTGSLDNGQNPRCPNCFPFKLSRFEQEIRESLGLPDEDVLFNQPLIGRKELDIYIPKYNLAIECNGVYWHSELQGRGKQYHLDKTTVCEERGIRLLHISDSLWYQKKDIVMSVINSCLGRVTKIHARKCVVKLVDSKTKTAFMTDNHLQGDAQSSVNLGLYLDSVLCAIMTFGKSRFDKKADWELIRYVQSKSTRIVGGASKLFSYFTKMHPGTSVVTYADRSLFSGKMYQAMGFTFSHHSKPGYHYFLRNTPLVLLSRMLFQKHKLSTKLEKFDPNVAEWENMKANGYDRIWDCGNSVWYYQRKN